MGVGSANGARGLFNSEIGRSQLAPGESNREWRLGTHAGARISVRDPYLCGRQRRPVR